MATQDHSSTSRLGGAAASGQAEREPTAPEDAETSARRVRSDASKVAGHAQEKATAFLDGQRRAAADHLENLSQPLHEAVDRLQERNPGLVSDYSRRAVDGLDTLAAALRDRDVPSMVRSVEGFARRQPGLFVAGSVAAGFLLARFLKSSAHGQDDPSLRRDDARYRSAREMRATNVEKEPR